MKLAPPFLAATKEKPSCLPRLVANSISCSRSLPRSVFGILLSSYERREMTSSSYKPKNHMVQPKEHQLPFLADWSQPPYTRIMIVTRQATFGFSMLYLQIRRGDCLICEYRCFGRKLLLGWSAVISPPQFAILRSRPPRTSRRRRRGTYPQKRRPRTEHV